MNIVEGVSDGDPLLSYKSNKMFSEEDEVGKSFLRKPVNL